MTRIYGIRRTIERLWKRAHRKLLGYDPFDATGYRVIVPISTQEAINALDLNDEQLKYAAVAARVAFELATECARLTDEGAELVVNTLLAMRDDT